MVGGAAERDSTVGLGRSPSTTARRHRARDREEALAVGQFEPLGDDLSGRLEHAMHGPEWAGTAVPGEGEARAVEPLGDIARWIDAEEEEGNALLSRFLQGGEAVGGLFETGAELAGERLDIIAARFDRLGEGGVGHQDRRGPIVGQCAASEAAATFGSELPLLQNGVERLSHLQIGNLECELKLAASSVERVVEEYGVAMPVIAAERPSHDVGRQAANAEAMPGAQPAGEATLRLGIDGEFFGHVVQHREAIAAGGEEAARFGDRIGRVIGGGALVGERQMLFAIAGIEAQQGFGDAGIIDGDIAGGEGGQVEIREHRVFEDGVKPGCLFSAAVARHLRHVELIGTREAQQHVSSQRPLVTFEQRDIGRGNVEIGGHVGLREAKVAAQPPQARPHIDRAVFTHRADSCAGFTTLQQIFVKIDN